MQFDSFVNSWYFIIFNICYLYDAIWTTISWPPGVSALDISVVPDT